MVGRYVVMLIVLVFRRLDYVSGALMVTTLRTCFTLCCKLYCLLLGFRAVNGLLCGWLVGDRLMAWFTCCLVGLRLVCCWLWLCDCLRVVFGFGVWCGGLLAICGVTLAVLVGLF